MGKSFLREWTHFFFFFYLFIYLFLISDQTMDW